MAQLIKHWTGPSKVLSSNPTGISSSLSKKWLWCFQEGPWEIACWIKNTHSMRPCFYESRYIGVTKNPRIKIFQKLPQWVAVLGKVLKIVLGKEWKICKTEIKFMDLYRWFGFFDFLTLQSIHSLKNKVPLIEYFFLIQQVFSQGAKSKFRS